MNILLRRINSESDTTIGYINVDGAFSCFTLEDEHRDNKVSGETRIPKGIYEIEKRKELSGLTKKYRAKYDWFDYHLELQDVPGFQFVYMHIGNDQKHTDGCILVGNQLISNKVTQKSNLLDSTSAFREFYKLVSAALDRGEKVMIQIIDMN